jgi:hypothetical protein
MTDALQPFAREQLDAEIAQYDYEHFGLRVVAELPEDGETLPPSRVWDDGEPTEALLPGTSALSLDDARSIEHALRVAPQYPGAYVLLLGANRRQHGTDAGEIVMADAIVLARWTR